jgi:energy-coupling factor transporter transmembrane protein EcfT
MLPSRTEKPCTGMFLKVLAVAALFLAAMHIVRWYPPGIVTSGIEDAATGFVRVAVPVVAVMFLARRITSEELYGTLIDLKAPPSVIVILFRTIWLVPRLTERMDDVVTAMRLRGMPMDTFLRRTRALAPAFGTIFSSMITEISENALVMTARGFLLPGVKTHHISQRFGAVDMFLTVSAAAVLVVLWF